MISADEVAALLRPEIQAALLAHADEAPERFALRFGQRSDWPGRAMAEQLRARGKAHAKLAGWPIDHLRFTTRALEQCSSLATARFKASLLSGEGVDLCCGLGVDAIHLAKRGAVTACERDPALALIARHNAAVLGSGLTVIAGDGLAWLASRPDRSLDWIYADPDRRDRDGRRRSALADCEPDLGPQLDELARVAPRLLLKLAPAVELDALRHELPSCQRLCFVSHRGECKEALALCEAGTRRSASLRAEAVVLDDAGAVRHRLHDDGAPLPAATPPGDWVLEPDPAILRAHALGSLARAHGLAPLHPQVAYLSGPAAPQDAPGRVLRVLEHGPYHAKDLRRRLQRLGIEGLQIARRHFPYAPEAIARQLKVKPSGAQRLLCYRDPAGDLRYVLGTVEG